MYLLSSIQGQRKPVIIYLLPLLSSIQGPHLPVSAYLLPLLSSMQGHDLFDGTQCLHYSQFWALTTPHGLSCLSLTSISSLWGRIILVTPLNRSTSSHSRSFTQIKHWLHYPQYRADTTRHQTSQIDFILLYPGPFPRTRQFDIHKLHYLQRRTFTPPGFIVLPSLSLPPCVMYQIIIIILNEGPSS